MISKKQQLYYEQPLQYASKEAVGRERRRQLKIACIWIASGVALILVDLVVYSLGWPSGDQQHGAWYYLPYGGYARSERFSILWAGGLLAAVPYGLYRLVRLRHYTVRGLRDSLIFEDAAMYKYDKEQRRLRAEARQRRWYNRQLLSDRTGLIMLVVFVTLALTVSVIVFGE